MSETLLQGDCLEVLKTLPDSSVDSIVTDPPYELGFMGKGWDRSGIANNVEMWSECLRVLKPGGHLLSFGGSRTYHRMACAVEDAGFEIRDQVMWVYGSGFPKSLDVSKAIDKAGGVSPQVQSELLRAKREAAGMSRDEVAERVGCTPASVRDWEEGRSRAVGRALEWITPSEQYRTALADLLGYTADERVIAGVATARTNDGSVIGLGHSGTLREGGHTDAARQWEGWGTALKPAHEPICVARKPLVGTVAANVLAHGTGALNIDACRVETEGASPLRESDRRLETNTFSTGLGGSRAVGETTLGRWPANVIHDGSDKVLDAFPDAPGQLANVSTTAPSEKTSNVYGKMRREGEATAAKRYTEEGSTNFAATPGMRRFDKGSAARFFYCAKASKKDRGEGNTHPTVKPTDLMCYLVRLVTPPGGTVLDPFMGSGSTGKAAKLEGFDFIGIDLTPAYVEIARKRIEEAV